MKTFARYILNPRSVVIRTDHGHGAERVRPRSASNVSTRQDAQESNGRSFAVDEIETSSAVALKKNAQESRYCILYVMVAS